MRSTDEQLNEVTVRAAKLRKKQRMCRIIAAESISACICLALFICSVRIISELEMTVQGSSMEYYGGMLLSSPSLGYVVIGVLGFILGICITLLCVHLHKQNEAGERS